MRNKTKRLLTIRKLIESELISSQEELLFRFERNERRSYPKALYPGT